MNPNLTAFKEYRRRRTKQLAPGCSQTCHGDRWLEKYVMAVETPMPDRAQDRSVRFKGVSLARLGQWNWWTATHLCECRSSKKMVYSSTLDMDCQEFVFYLPSWP